MKVSTALVFLLVLAPLVVLIRYGGLPGVYWRNWSALEGGTFYPADDESFAYAGRWQLNSEDHAARADWPCSRVNFSVTTAARGTSTIALRLNLHRLRVNVVVKDATGSLVSERILSGNAIFDYEKDYDIVLENKDAGTYTVSVTKLTQGSPYGNGLGSWLPSGLEFHGVAIDANIMTLGSSARPSRRVALIGASDTAGFCVDGTPETRDGNLNPWKYDNCDMTSHSVLGRRMDAEISVQAIAGIGLTQNAFANMPFLLGEDTMPDYYKRTLQNAEHPLWNFEQWRPDLVVVSLGGNDFNHQKMVPSNATFHEAYEDFILQVAQPYVEEGAPVPTIVSVCGQGDPTEAARDPNNDRCRPCPHVEDATESFRAKHGDLIRAEYVFVPCDGSVVTGKDDIGCEGHKNRLGQKRVADFLEPRLREIMGWSDDGKKEEGEETVSVKPMTRRFLRTT